METFIGIAGMAFLGYLIYKVVSFAYPFVICFWEICEVVYNLSTKFLKFICTPFKALFQLIRKKVPFENPLNKDNFLSRFSERHPTFGSAKSIVFVCLSILFICGTCLFYAPYNNQFLDQIPLSLPFFFVFDIFSNGFDFSLGSLISVGVSTILISLLPEIFMDDYEVCSVGSFFVAMLHYLSTTAVACFLSYFLRGLWTYIANGGLTLFGTLKNIVLNPGTTFWGWTLAILTAIPLILLIYVGVIFVVTSVRDFIDMLCYGIIGVLLFLLAALIIYLLTLILGTEINLFFEILLAIIAVICIFGADFIRIKIKDLLLEEDTEN